MSVSPKTKFYAPHAYKVFFFYIIIEKQVYFFAMMMCLTCSFCASILIFTITLAFLTFPVLWVNLIIIIHEHDNHHLLLFVLNHGDLTEWSFNNKCHQIIVMLNEKKLKPFFFVILYGEWKLNIMNLFKEKTMKKTALCVLRYL